MTKLLTSSTPTKRSIIRGPQEFWGGLVLMAVSILALWAAHGLPGMNGYSFGAGTAPRLFSILLFILGAGVSVTGLLTSGSPLARFSVRGPFFVMAAIALFSVSIRPLGLVIAAFASFVVAALGSEETRWPEAIIVGVALTLGCSLLFPYALGLPFELWPRI
jgi:putative tricarboxylic transport membrane protein